MNLNSVAKELCRREGKKKQVDMAQIKELLKHLADLLYEDYMKSNEYPNMVIMLLDNADKRAKRKNKK